MKRKFLILTVSFLLILCLAGNVSAQSKMYWTEQFSGAIKRADLDGSNPEDLITSGLDGPFRIA